MFATRLPSMLRRMHKVLCLAALLGGAASSVALADVVSGTFALGSVPGAVAVNPVTNKIYVVNGGSNTVTVIDEAPLGAAPLTLPTGTSPSTVAVNPATNKIYVANNGGSGVTVIDGAATDVVIGNYITGNGPIAIGINPVSNKVYVVNNQANSVTVLDGTSQGVIKTINVDTGPNAIGVNTLTNQIFVSSLINNTVAVIDGTTDSVLFTVPTNAYPFAVTVNPVGKKVYVLAQPAGATAATNNLTIIDTSAIIYSQAAPAGSYPTASVAVGLNAKTMAVNALTSTLYVATAQYSQSGLIHPGSIKTVNASNVVGSGVGGLPSNPRAISINPLNNTLYVADSGNNEVIAVDLALSATERIAVATGPVAVATHPITQRTYVVSQSAPTTLTRIEAIDNAVTTLSTGVNPRAAVVHPVTGKLYVANAGSNSVSVFDGGTLAPVLSIPVGNWPGALAMNPMTNKIYVANYSGNSVSVINALTDTVSATLSTNSYPSAVAVNTVTNKIYVANWGANTVTVIDGAVDLQQAFIPTNAAGPAHVAINPNTNKIYVAMDGEPTITVIDGARDAFLRKISVGTYPKLAINTALNKIYSVNSANNNVSIIDGRTDTVKATVAVGVAPSGAVVDHAGNRVYVPANLALSIFEADDTVTTVTRTGMDWPDTITLNPATGRIYVSNLSDSSVFVLAADNGSQLDHIMLAGNLRDVAIDPLKGRALVVRGAGTVNPGFVSVISEFARQFAAPQIAIDAPNGSSVATARADVSLSFPSYRGIPQTASDAYFQVDSWRGRWARATAGAGIYTGTTPRLAPGVHTLYAFGSNGMDAGAASGWHHSTIQPGHLAGSTFNALHRTAANNIPILNLLLLD